MRSTHGLSFAARRYTSKACNELARQAESARIFAKRNYRAFRVRHMQVFLCRKISRRADRNELRACSFVNILRASLNIRRAEACEKIFRQSKQKSARIVDPIRRIFVTNDGKDSVKISCDEFLEVPLNIPRKCRSNSAPHPCGTVTMIPPTRPLVITSSSLFCYSKRSYYKTVQYLFKSNLIYRHNFFFVLTFPRGCDIIDEVCVPADKNNILRRTT